MEAAPEARARPSSVPFSAPRVALVAAVGVAALALVETAIALIAPSRAPTETDWRGVSSAVRADFRPGDLLLAAPAWSDPVMRQYLGDLISIPTAARLDSATFGRVWEISQRGARSGESGAIAYEQRFGALTVRRLERPAAAVTYDFVAHWTDAVVSRTNGAGSVIACAKLSDRIQCPNISWNFVRRQLVEVDTRLREALLAQPVGGATVVIEFPAVPLGREITLATGLHDVWMRKAARGPVDLRVIVDGQPNWKVTTRNQSGWLLTHVDTAALEGRTVAVRFEISSPAPYARHFVLAAEARR
ncbi:MAG TPA: hypothetical protein VGL59_09945 [Polyangia bacterium]